MVTIASPSALSRPVLRIINVETDSNNDEQFSNMHSLVVMVIWTTGQLSLYSGGDANWYVSPFVWETHR